MNSDFPEWQKLVSAARGSVDSRDTTAPYGFATRVVARVKLGEAPGVSVLLARWSLRALLVAGALSAIVAAVNLRSVLNAIDEEALALGDTTVVEQSEAS